jgi:hypothetical protein
LTRPILCLFKQWEKLEPHLTTSERKSLDQKYVGLTSIEAREKLVTSSPLGFFICGFPLGIKKSSESGRRLQWWKRNSRYHRARKTGKGNPACRHHHGMASFREGMSNSAGADEMPNAQEMLNIEKDRAVHSTPRQWHSKSSTSWRTLFR